LKCQSVQLTPNAQLRKLALIASAWTHVQKLTRVLEMRNAVFKFIDQLVYVLKVGVEIQEFNVTDPNAHLTMSVRMIRPVSTKNA
jgi:hypothetical protein